METIKVEHIVFLFVLPIACNHIIDRFGPIMAWELERHFRGQLSCSFTKSVVIYYRSTLYMKCMYYYLVLFLLGPAPLGQVDSWY